MADLTDWWEKWWAEDFTWEGLAKKRWKGWMVLDGEPQPDPSSYPKKHENYAERPAGARNANAAWVAA